MCTNLYGGGGGGGGVCVGGGGEGRGVEPPTKFQKSGGLVESQFLDGVLKYLMTIEVYKQKCFSISQLRI